MSCEPLSTTDGIQEFSDRDSLSISTIATQQSMPPDEHRTYQQPVQLSDLYNFDDSGREGKAGHLIGLFKKRQVEKNAKPTKPNNDARNTTHHRRSNAKNGRLDSRKSGNLAPLSARGPSTPTSIIADELRRSTDNAAHSSPTVSHHSNTSRHSDENNMPNRSPGLFKKPVARYQKAKGEVPRHTVNVLQPSVLHTSIHLAHTSSNNYRAKDKGRRVTNFGDFINHTWRLSDDQPPMPQPPLPASPASPLSPSRRFSARNSIIDESIHRNPIDDILSEIISENHSEVVPQQCSICGTPNSPCTRYGDQGLWLCTACRSPMAPIEFPPRRDSKYKSQKIRESSMSHIVANEERSSDQPSCEHCLSILAPVQRDGSVFCSWCCREVTGTSANTDLPPDASRLTLLKASRYQSVATVATQEARQGWEDFDSEVTYDNASTTPPALLSSNVKVYEGAREQSYHGQKPEKYVKPTPPLKDSIYLSPKHFIPNLHSDFAPSPPMKDPPLLSAKYAHSTKSHQVDLSDRDSYYPDTPISPPQTSDFAIPPYLPSRPIQKYDRARDSSNTSRWTAETFPFPPPPIPKDTYLKYRSQRSSSIYPDDPVPRLGTPDWQHKSPDRNTTFYEYWETIFRDDGR